ncbi:MAG: hypothetical protein Q8O83_00710 [bacterium]|nr:hypothetical protein [bacterium]
MHEALQNQIEDLCDKIHNLNEAKTHILFAEYGLTSQETRSKIEKETSLLGRAYKNITLEESELKNKIFNTIKEFEQKRGRESVVLFLVNLIKQNPWAYKTVNLVTSIFEEKKDPILITA